MGDEPKRRRDGSLWSSPLPARGITRTAPAFERGNQVATDHGAYSPRRIAARSEEVRERLEEYAPELASPLWDEARSEYCWTAARVQLIRESIARTVEKTGDIAHVKPTLLQELSRAEALADRLRGELGLTPASAARISRDIAASRQGRRTHNDGPVLGARGRQIRIEKGRFDPEKPLGL